MNGLGISSVLRGYKTNKEFVSFQPFFSPENNQL